MAKNELYRWFYYRKRGWPTSDLDMEAVIEGAEERASELHLSAYKAHEQECFNVWREELANAQYFDALVEELTEAHHA